MGGNTSNEYEISLVVMEMNMFWNLIELVVAQPELCTLKVNFILCEFHLNQKNCFLKYMLRPDPEEFSVY